MEVYIADHAGYCFGVKNAVNVAVDTLKNAKDKSTYSLGPLIHNPQVVSKLNSKGLKVVNKIDDTMYGDIIIRAHGVPYAVEERINESNLELVDCTCPYVKSVHKKVNEYNNNEYKVIIIGDKDHPEVIGINGWCNDEGIIVNSEEDAKRIFGYDKICIVSQTTNTLEKFQKLANIIKSQGKEVKIINTICNATNLRQTACKSLAKKVDAMVVIGGYESSNTNKLEEISRIYCKNVYHIEISEELPLQEIVKFNTIGITAGASTPDWIIREVVDTVENINNNEIDNNEIMEAIENSLVTIQKGDVVKGNVIYVTKNEVMVNINYKSDGIITKEELSNDPDVKPKDLFNEGDEVEVYIARLDDGEGNVVLSTKRLTAIKGWEELEKVYENKEEIDCKVLTDIKGGLSVLVNGITGFMPASQISVKYIDDLSVFKNQNITAKIIDFDRRKNRIILSRKAVEKEKLKDVRQKVWDSLGIGNIIDGKVERLTDFGAFIDIGGLDGLVHISDLSWVRIKHPSEVINIGDDVKVEILDFNKEKNRISLGLKQTLPQPWGLFMKNRKIGDIVFGEIVNVLDFGAFIRLEEGVDGLVHVSQISNEHISKPSDVLKVGEKVKVKIIDIKEDDERISLSMKAIDKDEEGNIKEIENEDIDVTIGDVLKDI